MSSAVQDADVTGRSLSDAIVAVFGFAALAVAMGIGRFAFTPLLPMMQDDKGLSIVAGSWLAAANYAGYLAGAMLAMAITVRHPGAIRAGLVIIGGVTASMAMTEDFALWLVLRALAGVASAWVMIHVSAWCFEAARRAIFTGIVFGGVGGGITGAGLLCLIFTSNAWDSDRAWIALGIVSLVIAALTWGAFDGTTSVHTDATVDELGAGLWTGDTLRLVFCYGIFGFSYILPATFLPVLAKRVIDDPQVFGWAWPLFGLAACVSVIASAGLRRIFGERILWAASHAAMAVGIALPAVWNGLAAILIAALSVGCAFMVATMVALAEAKKTGGMDAGKLVAAMTASFALGQIVAPVGVSLFGDNSIARSLLLASALLAATAIGLVWSPRKSAIRTLE